MWSLNCQYTLAHNFCENNSFSKLFHRHNIIDILTVLIGCAATFSDPGYFPYCFANRVVNIWNSLPILLIVQHHQHSDHVAKSWSFFLVDRVYRRCDSVLVVFCLLFYFINLCTIRVFCSVRIRCYCGSASYHLGHSASNKFDLIWIFSVNGINYWHPRRKPSEHFSSEQSCTGSNYFWTGFRRCEFQRGDREMLSDEIVSGRDLCRERSLPLPSSQCTGWFKSKPIRNYQ